MSEVKSQTSDIGNPRNPYDSLAPGERKKRVLRLLAGVYLRQSMQDGKAEPAADDRQLAFDWKQTESITRQG